MCDQLIDKRIEEMHKTIIDMSRRLIRLESRHVQLMYFMGASPFERYTTEDEWEKFDTPTCQRHGNLVNL